MLRKTCAALAVLVVLASVSAAHAELTFVGTNESDFASVRVTPYFDADPGDVRYVIELACSFKCSGIAGGFQAIAPASFSQNPTGEAFRTSIAANDTAFFGSPTFPGVTADSDSLLYTQGAIYLGETWPGTGTSQFFNFAQLVLPADGGARTVNDVGVYGPIQFIRGNELIGLLSGTVGVVPEPATLSLMFMGLFSLGLIAYKRHGSKA